MSVFIKFLLKTWGSPPLLVNEVQPGNGGLLWRYVVRSHARPVRVGQLDLVPLGGKYSGLGVLYYLVGFGRVYRPVQAATDDGRARLVKKTNVWFKTWIKACHMHPPPIWSTIRSRWLTWCATTTRPLATMRMASSSHTKHNHLIYLYTVQIYFYLNKLLITRILLRICAISGSDSWDLYNPNLWFNLSVVFPLYK